MRVYDEIMVPRMFEPWGNVLLDELALAPGEAVLDIATGPGTIARLAAARVGPSGRVVGCDLSPAMLAIARGKPPIPGAAPISYIECSADALDVPSDSVDAVTCQQGLQFFPDRPAALAEMRRAARGGARLGIAVWGPIEQTPPYDAVAQGIAAVLHRSGRAERAHRERRLLARDAHPARASPGVRGRAEPDRRHDRGLGSRAAARRARRRRPAGTRRCRRSCGGAVHRGRRDPLVLDLAHRVRGRLSAVTASPRRPSWPPPASPVRVSPVRAWPVHASSPGPGLGAR